MWSWDLHDGLYHQNLPSFYPFAFLFLLVLPHHALSIPSNFSISVTNLRVESEEIVCFLFPVYSADPL